eukprot:gene2187-2489_t
MHWPITSKPWSLCNDKGDSRGSSKSLFPNNMQLPSPNGASAIPPQDIDCCIVDSMRVVRIMPINDLNPPNPSSCDLLSSLHSQEPNEEELVDFTLHYVYNRPKNETTPGESRYTMLFNGNAKAKCLSEQLNPTAYGSESRNDSLQPNWFEGNALPTEEELSEMFQESENTHTYGEEQKSETNSEESTNGIYDASDVDSDIDEILDSTSLADTFNAKPRKKNTAQPKRRKTCLHKGCAIEYKSRGSSIFPKAIIQFQQFRNPVSTHDSKIIDAVKNRNRVSKKEKEGKVDCDDFGQKFSSVHCLYKHRKRKHPGNGPKHDTKQEPISCVQFPDYSCATMAKLIDHATEKHGENLEAVTQALQSTRNSYMKREGGEKNTSWFVKYRKGEGKDYTINW